MEFKGKILGKLYQLFNASRLICTEILSSKIVILGKDNNLFST